MPILHLFMTDADKYNSRRELLAKHILKVCNRHIAYNLKPL